MSKKNNYELVVIGGSSGGLDAVLKIVAKLSPSFALPIVIVLHQMRNKPSSLTEVIQSRTKIKVSEPEDKEPILPKHIYVAPPDYHLMVEKNKTFSYSYSELVNYSRPSIDVLFESAADAYMMHLAAVLLSGSNADGANGMLMIKEKGGHTIVQNPETAESPVMPKSAITKTKIDLILDLNNIAETINKINNGDL